MNRRMLTPDDMYLMGLGKTKNRYWPDDSDTGISFDQVSDGRHKQAAINYLSKLDDMIKHGFGILFYGSCGVGKTSLAVLMSHEMRRMGYTVYFVRAYELKDAIINHRQWNDDVSVDDRVKTVEVLVIDDLGKESSLTGSGWSESYFENLIRVRSDFLRPTIITSNYSPTELKNSYKESMTDVMKGYIWPILVDGKNFRNENHKKMEKLLK